MNNTTTDLSEHPVDFFTNFEDFFNTSPDLLCVAGFDGYFKRINPSVSKLLGYSNEELFSKPINDFVFDDDKKNTKNARKDLTQKIGLYNFENRYVTKSGNIVWLLWTSFPVAKDKLVYAIAKNITFKKELEQERNAHLTELTKVNKELKQLTYTTAHDLRSPVNNLLAVFDLLDKSTITNPETLELISIIEASTQTLKKTLIDHVAILDKKNEEDNQLEILDFNIILQEVLSSINSLIQNSKAKITIDFSEADTIIFNRNSLKSIFLNLITNSIKYSKPGALPIINFNSLRFNGSTQLIITDNGIGFDMEKVKDRIFGLHQKFNSHKDSNGIGLYLVYNHVTNLGGHISLESNLNEGAKFTITF
ncbi:PAS domain-containing sensor histidine kinase [Flavobacterium hibernum]|uniref:histidine kinase n=1 Tax=Flavobacterium hibernum TaxID=37752 RepID=A0A0D0EUM9_9FLAO|nr:PAS domain-containing sensor histidine kinase [Flavobacterium hibernum]KIO52528.1 histidine kinase [Flavobacterium hibernum]OXA89161.1 PAS domain-containing sensor histidine kinase [Flavobacterium hibernum]